MDLTAVYDLGTGPRRELGPGCSKARGRQPMLSGQLGPTGPTAWTLPTKGEGHIVQTGWRLKCSCKGLPVDTGQRQPWCPCEKHLIAQWHLLYGGDWVPLARSPLLRRHVVPLEHQVPVKTYGKR
jgi:hypothetical protein